MTLDQLLGNFNNVSGDTEVVIHCGNSVFGIESVNAALEIVSSREQSQTVESLRRELSQKSPILTAKIRVRIDDDVFDIDMTALGISQSMSRIPDQLEYPKLIIFLENNCIEKYGLHDSVL